MKKRLSVTEIRALYKQGWCFSLPGECYRYFLPGTLIEPGLVEASLQPPAGALRWAVWQVTPAAEKWLRIRQSENEDEAAKSCRMAADELEVENGTDFKTKLLTGR